MVLVARNLEAAGLLLQVHSGAQDRAKQGRPEQDLGLYLAALDDIEQ